MTSVDVEDWSARRYQEARRVPCEIAGPVRRLTAEGGRWGRQAVTWAVVSVRVEGEAAARDVSACRVRVDGVALCDAMARIHAPTPA
jgi:hypothetical protein